MQTLVKALQLQSSCWQHRPLLLVLLLAFQAWQQQMAMLMLAEELQQSQMLPLQHLQARAALHF
jgi:hypothetical protein